MAAADKRYEYVVFDVDGTLVDSERANLVSLQRTLLELTGRRYELEDLRFTLGLPDGPALRQLGFEQPDEAERAGRRWEQLAEREAASNTVYPGIRSTIEELHRRGIGTGVASSRARHEYAEQISPLGIDDLFDHIVLVEDTERHKPEPDPLLECLRRAGVAAERALYVGDAEYDVRCATSAGVDFALAGWGAQRAYGGERYVLQRPEDLLALVQAL
ncbi:MAG: HAD family hydrolase [Parafannyhessea sp.]|uniref:HAD family hydrolase n=1 Tax=Parafannyhessea sp. TaxID=2847324 RepID=UPI003F0DBFB3